MRQNLTYPRRSQGRHREMQAVRRRYCKDEEEHKDMQQMANFLVNVEWCEEEQEAPTTWFELFVCYKLMGGHTKGDEAKEQKLERRNPTQQAVKEF